MSFTTGTYRSRARTYLVHLGTALITPPASEPLEIDDAKRHARVLEDTEDYIVETLIKTARQQVELDTGMALLTQTLDISLDAIYDGVTQIQLPIRPIQSVTSITSYDTANVGTFYTASNYTLDSISGRIVLVDGSEWPSDLRTHNALVMRIVAGYTSVSLIPETLLHAMRLLVSHYYAHRGALGEGRPAPNEPAGYRALIRPFEPVTLV